MDTGAARRIFLIGPMGSGKSTVGRRVAKRLGLRFVDCDQLLEERTGASVQLIFEIEGECGFRQREAALLEELAGEDDVLIATGGGVITQAENRRLLQDRGLVVYLQTGVARQLKRLVRDKQRPLLQAPDRRQRLERLAAERNPLYQDCADITMTSGQTTVTAMADRLSRAIRAYWKDNDKPS